MQLYALLCVAIAALTLLSEPRFSMSMRAGVRGKVSIGWKWSTEHESEAKIAKREATKRARDPRQFEFEHRHVVNSGHFAEEASRFQQMHAHAMDFVKKMDSHSTVEAHQAGEGGEADSVRFAEAQTQAHQKAKISEDMWWVKEVPHWMPPPPEWGPVSIVVPACLSPFVRSIFFFFYFFFFFFFLVCLPLRTVHHR